MEEVSKRCADKNSCKVPANNGVFGDSCPRVHKYLEVDYQCIQPEGSPTNTITCEQEELRYVNKMSISSGIH